MPESKPPLNEYTSQLGARLRRMLQRAGHELGQMFSFLRSKTEDTRHQLKEVFYTTSDQVLERPRRRASRSSCAWRSWKSSTT